MDTIMHVNPIWILRLAEFFFEKKKTGEKWEKKTQKSKQARK